LSYPQTNVFLVCFSVVSKTSYQNIVDKWLPEIRHHMPYAPILLVGTKSDLRNDQKFLDSNIEGTVSSSEGTDLKNKIKAYAYVECSAKAKSGVKEVFEEAIRAGTSGKKKTTDSGKKTCSLL
jgi:Ras-related C3 botulinum toxin substrate 1